MRTFVGFDVDPLAHTLAKPRVEAAAKEVRREGDAPFRFAPVAANFREMRRVLSEMAETATESDVLFGNVDGILMLGDVWLRERQK